MIETMTRRGLFEKFFNRVRAVAGLSAAVGVAAACESVDKSLVTFLEDVPASQILYLPGETKISPHAALSSIDGFTKASANQYREITVTNTPIIHPLRKDGPVLLKDALVGVWNEEKKEMDYVPFDLSGLNYDVKPQKALKTEKPDEMKDIKTSAIIKISSELK